MDTAGYLASVLIGISLGLIGGGGSILTVPVLVYLFHLGAVSATAYSLFIVGATSLTGSVSYFRKGLVDLKTVFVFGIPSVISVFFTRTYIIPVIPQNILSIGEFTITKSIFLLLLFAILMIFASYGMIKKNKETTSSEKIQFSYPLVITEGVLIGVLTGLIGAGGGFLIIPALVNFMKLSMKTAIGTSLVIIAINSLAGFLFSIPHISIHWNFILSITGLAIIGILAGSYISTKIDGKKLKPAFGWFILIMGIYIIIKEALLS
ncbi:sulfite exporter TauE/SafE family protein [Elizabethkingia ursingii]|uniref:sulfite exporter TauE/SafE family protein n=1 Tax=Elizabethkingia ursingii TaxID=1756150 RepID=UPI002013BB34|nr:sulfite exporter TauE/SafE family protein [Elizabethkingia ursingii]MCL1671089.1 sulfite exporter TauE/SafE family protein [Elizabethkingia ursingii]